MDLKPTGRGQNNISNNKNVSSSLNKISSSRDKPENQVQTGGGALGAGMQGVVMIIVVIIVLVGIGVGAFIMMKSKQQTPFQY
jgi:predicted metalloprotease